MSCGVFHEIVICIDRDFSQILQLDLGNGFIDLSAYQFSATLKDSISSTSISYDLKFRLLKNDKAVQMYLDDKDTSAMIAGSYEWDLLVTTPRGIDLNLLYGFATVKSTSTRKNTVRSEANTNDFILL